MPPPPPQARTSYIPHPREYAYAAAGPFWGSVAAAIGGVLILIQGILVELYGASFGLTYWLLFSLSPTTEGSFMATTGILVFTLAWLAYHAPGNHRADGAMIWILVFLCTLTGTIVGFWLGALLAFVGAAHIWSWNPASVGGPAAIRRAVRPG